jgi:hypothetical protein
MTMGEMTVGAANTRAMMHPTSTNPHFSRFMWTNVVNPKAFTFCLRDVNDFNRTSSNLREPY